MRIKLILVLAGIALPMAVMSQFVNPLIIPDTIAGTTFNLTMGESDVNFLPGDSTYTYGINADYLGPTLIFNSGDFIQLNVTNAINDTTTMHWHGMHVAPEDDGGPHTAINPGETWSPDFTVLDEASTMWYHPHLHEKTAEQVYLGAAGMIIIRDDHEAGLELPRTYGVDDFPIIIQDKSFDDDNQLIFTAMADTMMVNGTLAPYLEVPAQRVRFRFLNASNQRVYNILLPPTTSPMMIASDGGLLEAPIPIPSVNFTPGERVEMVVDFTGFQDSVFYMISASSDLPFGASGGPGGLNGPPGNNLDSTDFRFLELRVVAANSNPSGPIPNSLNTHEIWDEAQASVVRTKVFDTLNAGFPYYINGTPFNHHHINDTAYLDDIEIWEIINTTDIAHPFHIHDVQYYILDINGNPPPPSMAGRKDVMMVNIDDTIRFITKFEDFANDSIPYMYHCHNLFHEDAGMMGQFLVIDPADTVSALGTAEEKSPLLLYPNPTSNEVVVKMPTRVDGGSIAVKDILGRPVTVDWERTDVRWVGDVSKLSRGTYLIQVIDDGRMQTARFIKE